MLGNVDQSQTQYVVYGFPDGASRGIAKSV